MNKLLIIIAMSACYAMIFLDMSGVAVVLPNLKQNLMLSTSGMQWAMNSFILTMAIFLLMGGKLGDRYGHRKIFMFGLIIFIASSVICALAQGQWSIISGRILQGIGASFLMPTIAVLIQRSFPDNEYGKAFGTILLFSNLFYALGPFLGGILAEYFSWRGIFWINLPIGIVCYYCTKKSIQVDVVKAYETHFDYKGLFLFVIAISAIVIATMQGEKVGWTSFSILGLFVLGVISLICFICIELSMKDPLLEIRLFHNKIFMAGNVILCSGYMSFAAIIFWPLWLSHTFHYSAMMIGAAMLPATIPTIFVPRYAGVWRDKSGPRAPMICGVWLTIVGIAWIALTASIPNYWIVLPGLLGYGFGLPMFIPNAVTVIMTSVEEKNRGMASGVFATLRQVALAFGFSIIAAVVAATETHVAYSKAFSYGMASIGIFVVISIVFVYLFIPAKK